MSATRIIKNKMTGILGCYLLFLARKNFFQSLITGIDEFLQFFFTAEFFIFTHFPGTFFRLDVAPHFLSLPPQGDARFSKFFAGKFQKRLATLRGKLGEKNLASLFIGYYRDSH